MADKRLKLSQELDRLIVLFYKEPTAENKENIERKRRELYAYCE
jgi:hypothetical protein